MPSTKGIGTKAVGYAGPENGPFRCGHCQWFKSPRNCGHPEVIADPEMRKDSNGNAIVAPDGCCNEFRPVKKISEVKFEDVGL